MLDNPFAFRKDYFAAFLALIDTVDKEPNLKAEMERESIILICPHISGQMQIASKKPVDSAKDLKGKTIRTYGGGRGKYLEAFGLNPIFMSYSEIYEALDRGTIDAAEMVMMLSQTFKHYEVAKYVYMTNAGGALASGVYMNRKVFNKFPKDIQEMFIKLRLEYSERYANGTQDLEVGFYRDWETKHGIKIVYPSPEDQKALNEAGQKATDFILKQQESGGHKGARKVWDYYMTALKKYEDQRAKKK
jgi:TRAP-type C4-dicarboxylate transport system substrate-binding protein